jgi:hypothetical protein
LWWWSGQRGDAYERATQAHALKGTVNIFDASRVRVRSQELQDLGQSGDVRPAHRIYELFREDIAKLEEKLKRYAQLAKAGRYRTTAEAMQVVSGAIHTPKVRFTAVHAFGKARKDDSKTEETLGVGGKARKNVHDVHNVQRQDRNLLSKPAIFH